MGTDNNACVLDRIDYLILTALNENNATSAIVGMTIKELEITEVKRVTVWRHMEFLVENKLVCQAGYYARQKMYYITKAGIKIIGGNDNEQ